MAHSISNYHITLVEKANEDGHFSVRDEVHDVGRVLAAAADGVVDGR